MIIYAFSQVNWTQIIRPDSSKHIFSYTSRSLEIMEQEIQQELHRAVKIFIKICFF